MRKLRLEDVADPTSGLMKNCPVDLVSAVRLLASHAVDSPRRPGRVASAVTAQVRALVREAEHATRHRIDALDREIKSTALHSRAATSALYEALVSRRHPLDVFESRRSDGEQTGVPERGSAASFWTATG